MAKCTMMLMPSDPRAAHSQTVAHCVVHGMPPVSPGDVCAIGAIERATEQALTRIAAAGAAVAAKIENGD